MFDVEIVEKCRMAKASLRGPGLASAARASSDSSLGTAAVAPAAETNADGPARPVTADELLRAIAQLYDELQAFPGANEAAGGRRACPAYVALEQQIRAHADRYTAVTGWTTVGASTRLYQARG